MLYRYVGRKISCFADVEDLVQESFVRAFFNLQSFDTDRNFGLWIRAICRNTTYRFLSKGRRACVVLCAEDPSWIENEPSEQEQKENTLLKPLRHCVQSLKKRERTLVTLRYYHEMSIDDMTEHLGRPYGSIAQTLWRIRGDIRKRMFRHMSVQRQVSSVRW